MLVLTRKSQDSIRIGDNITVTILRIKGNTVRIGVDAPDDVRIVRGELPRFEDPVETPIGNEGLQLRQPGAGRGGGSSRSQARVPFNQTKTATPRLDYRQHHRNLGRNLICRPI